MVWGGTCSTLPHFATTAQGRCAAAESVLTNGAKRVKMVPAPPGSRGRTGAQRGGHRPAVTVLGDGDGRIDDVVGVAGGGRGGVGRVPGGGHRGVRGGRRQVQRRRDRDVGRVERAVAGVARSAHRSVDEAVRRADRVGRHLPGQAGGVSDRCGRGVGDRGGGADRDAAGRVREPPDVGDRGTRRVDGRGHLPLSAGERAVDVLVDAGHGRRHTGGRAGQRVVQRERGSARTAGDHRRGAQAEGHLLQSVPLHVELVELPRLLVVRGRHLCHGRCSSASAEWTRRPATQPASSSSTGLPPPAEVLCRWWHRLATGSGSVRDGVSVRTPRRAVAPLGLSAFGHDRPGSRLSSRRTGPRPVRPVAARRAGRACSTPPRPSRPCGR